MRFRISFGFLAVLMAIAIFDSSTCAIAQVSPAASPSPSPSAPSPAFFLPFLNRKALYVMGVSGDPATRAKFVAELTAELQAPSQSSSLSPEETRLNRRLPRFGDRLVVPEPDWAFSDYLTACQNFPNNTLGAMIVAVTSLSNGAKSYFIGRNNWTDISAVLFYANCDPGYSGKPSVVPQGVNSASSISHSYTVVAKTKNARKSTTREMTDQRVKFWTRTPASPPPTPSPTSTPPPTAFVWYSNLHTERGKVPFLTPLPALGVLLTLVSAYTALAPSRTTSGVTTTVFETPKPKQTYPPEGTVSENQVTNSTTTNANQENAVASAFLGQGITYSGTVTSIPTGDEQATKAVRKLVPELLQDLGCSDPWSPVATPAAGQAPSVEWVCAHIYE
jgi:hypothetical protein